MKSQPITLVVLVGKISCPFSWSQTSWGWVILVWRSHLPAPWSIQSGRDAFGLILVTVYQVRKPNARLPLWQPKAGLTRKMLERFCDLDSHNSVKTWASTGSPRFSYTAMPPGLWKGSHSWHCSSNSAPQVSLSTLLGKGH